MISKGESENANWEKISNSAQVDAWFAAVDSSGSSTIIVNGVDYKDRDIVEEIDGNQIFRFRFDDIEGNQINLTATALERVAAEECLD